jgi:formate-dependent nitrite reductase membrane component NrfD
MAPSPDTGGDPPPAGGRAPGEIRSYHGQPVIKEPVWTWEIPCYFFTGGLAGASGGLAFMVELRGNDVLARRAWATALAGLGVSPALLISDLGRPDRFLNMMRMFKITSPMSVGSWILAGSGAATAIAATNSLLGWFPRLGRAAKPSAALLGLPLSTYTAALVANTAVPVWHESHRLLPFVFGSGAGLSAGAAAVIVTTPANAAPARRLALGAAALELGLQAVMERRLGELGRPYRRGAPARFSRISRSSIAAGAALLYRRGGSSRTAAMTAGTLLCIGALTARFSVFKAGFVSASDPAYVVGPQRAAIRSGARRGAARRGSKVAEGDPALGSPATVVVPPTDRATPANDR